MPVTKNTAIRVVIDGVNCMKELGSPGMVNAPVSSQMRLLERLENPDWTASCALEAR